MKLFKWTYGALALIATVFLIISFFMPDVKPLTQITLLIESVGFAWICGAYVSADM